MIEFLSLIGLALLGGIGGGFMGLWCHKAGAWLLGYLPKRRREKKLAREQAAFWDREFWRLIDLSQEARRSEDWDEYNAIAKQLQLVAKRCGQAEREVRGLL